MKGGVRKRGKKWYYYFELAIVEGKRKKIERVGGATKKEAQTALRIALKEKKIEQKELNLKYGQWYFDSD